MCCSVQLPDDSTNTYVRALKDTITEDICMVLIILPTNRKDRYDAIKTICCIESAGETLFEIILCFSACLLFYLYKRVYALLINQQISFELLQHSVSSVCPRTHEAA
jgi:hypothetical protein